jgi:NAD-dependent deacetylase
MHGELLKMRCTRCSTVFPVTSDITLESVCEKCRKKGHLRPDIVWFGEMPYEMETISSRLSECDLFISIGTSGNVYPAAGFAQMARMSGAHTVELNLEPSLTRSVFAEGRYGKATDVVPAYVEEILGSH